MTTLSEVAQELAREGKTKASVYPLWVEAGKLSKEQADHRLECTRLAFLIVNALAHHPEALKALDETPEGHRALERIERTML